MNDPRQRFPSLGRPGAGAQRANVVVPEALAGERLDRALAALIPEISRTRARKAIDMGAVFIGVEKCRISGRKVWTDNHLTVTWHPDITTAPKYPLLIVFEDEDIVVLDKAPGQLSQGTELGDTGTLIRSLEAAYGPDIRLMHRLDAPASGLLLAAKTRKASGFLTPQFRDHSLGRAYTAVTEGVPAAGLCDTALVKDGRRMRIAGPGEDGMPARTDVSILAQEGTRTCIRATLSTGRTHQIRVHLSSLGAPLVGDRRYGGPPADRMCLHATWLSFEHPDGGRAEFECLPDRVFWEIAGMEVDLGGEKSTDKGPE